MAAAEVNPLTEYSVRGWRFVKVLGSGTYGRVIEAVDIKSGETKALKIIIQEPTTLTKKADTKSEDTKTKLRQDELSEIAAQRFLKNHPNIAAIEKVMATTTGEIVLVMELAAGDLKWWLTKRPRTAREIVMMMRGILRGVEALHACGIMHLDLKPANVLISRVTGEPLIADFGLTQSTLGYRTPYRTLVSLWWRPPELLCGKTKHEPAADLWAVGVIFVWIMTTGIQLFNGEDENETVNMIAMLMIGPRTYWEQYTRENVRAARLAREAAGDDINNNETKAWSHLAVKCGVFASAKEGQPETPTTVMQLARRIYEMKRGVTDVATYIREEETFFGGATQFRGLWHLVWRLLHLNPKDRIPSANELYAAFGVAATTDMVRATAAEVAYPTLAPDALILKAETSGYLAQDETKLQQNTRALARLLEDKYIALSKNSSTPIGSRKVRREAALTIASELLYDGDYLIDLFEDGLLTPDERTDIEVATLEMARVLNYDFWNGFLPVPPRLIAFQQKYQEEKGRNGRNGNGNENANGEDGETAKTTTTKKRTSPLKKSPPQQPLQQPKKSPQKKSPLQIAPPPKQTKTTRNKKKTGDTTSETDTDTDDDNGRAKGKPSPKFFTPFSSPSQSSHQKSRTLILSDEDEDEDESKETKYEHDNTNGFETVDDGLLEEEEEDEEEENEEVDGEEEEDEEDGRYKSTTRTGRTYSSDSKKAPSSQSAHRGSPKVVASPSKRKVSTSVISPF